jgi:hypothetical protein
MTDAEMAWDDSALNITVNPMENLGSGNVGSPGAVGDEGEESWDEDDDASSYRDDESSSDGDDEGDVRGSSCVAPAPCTGPSQLNANSSETVNIASSTSGKHNKELEWDHSAI